MRNMLLVDFDALQYYIVRKDIPAGTKHLLYDHIFLKFNAAI